MTEDDMQEELLTIQSTIGDVQLNALRTGGDKLLDDVIIKMGPAIRHVERIRAHLLTLTPAVREEIAASIGRARLEIQQFRPDFGPKKGVDK